jgi:tyrosine-protein kinase Etk/Wzc
MTTEHEVAISNPENKARTVGFFDLLLILLERKWFLAIGLAVVSVAAVTYVLLATSYYTATAVILPSKQSPGASLGALMGDLPISGLLKSFDFLGGENNSRLLSILDSRRLADKVIERFDLVSRYEFNKKKKFYREDVLKEFRKNARFEEDDLENIRVVVTDTNPAVAAEMANYIVAVLDSLSYQVNKESARGSRMFFEERLAQLRLTLDSVHQRFAKFQSQHNIVDLEDQVKISIEALAALEAEAIAADVEKAVLSSTFGNNARMEEMRRKKKVISAKLDTYLEEGSGSLVLPLKKAPQLAIEYAYLLRDVKVQETLFGLMLQMYEQAKFREVNNSPMVTILETAEPPQKRSRPKRAILCITAFFIGFAVLSIYVLLEKWYMVQRAGGTSAYRQLQTIKGHFLPRK